MTEPKDIEWPWPNPRNDLVNCRYCGRDTRARDCICKKCGGLKSNVIPESLDREIFRIDGENATELLAGEIHEDDYSESYNERRLRDDLHEFDDEARDDKEWGRHKRKYKRGENARP